ncbi:hypothetical protein CDV49_16710 [Haematobacter genomosp. 1]|uniref:Uncharacterized protein n=2 Tax=Haematobacter genomosp. 1 TaxID=366618 RepID=A0A212A7X1_9RHOB|nr:hypothetical protein CDV49_16710 [Haematobacter genomosp. 1]
MLAWKFIPLGVCLGLLNGCGAVDEIDRINKDSDRSQCNSYGFVQGTNAFAECMMRMDRQRERQLSGVDDRSYRRSDRDRDRDRGRGDAIDTRPQFDSDGNPNFDTQGNYIGCHGIGCVVDNPDS